MLTVNMHDAKSQLSKLVDVAESGEEVIIARNGKPAAKLVPLTANVTRRIGGGRAILGDSLDHMTLALINEGDAEIEASIDDSDLFPRKED